MRSTAYEIPSRIVAPLRRSARSADNGLSRALAPFGIRPDLWARKPRIVGNERVAGVEVVHLTADIDAERFFIDASRFTRALTSLRITGVTGLPQAIGPGAQAALTRSVTSARGDLYTGASDHVLRRARLKITFSVAAGAVRAPRAAWTRSRSPWRSASR